MTSYGTCSECNRPLNDGEYFILNGDGTGIHHECPIGEEEVVDGETVHALGAVYHKDRFDSKLLPFDQLLTGTSKTMNTTASHAAHCPICGERIAHDDQTVMNGDDTCHFDCVREINADLDARDKGCPECGSAAWGYADGPGDGCICNDCGHEWDANAPEYDGGEMDGNHESALASAGFGTDEDYGFGGYDD